MLGQQFALGRLARPIRTFKGDEETTYERFGRLADGADEAVATRRAIYAMWRRRAAERTRTMGYLACGDTRVIPFAGAFPHRRPDLGLGGAAWRSGQWGHAGRVAGALLVRLRWLVVGMRPGPLTW
jgi:hypothetical protein